MAFVMYTNENKGKFPYAARYDIPRAEDFIWWQETPYLGRKMLFFRQSAIAHYLSHGSLLKDYFLCPSDDVQQRPAHDSGGGCYRYSYTMNYFLEDSRTTRSTGTRPPAPARSVKARTRSCSSRRTRSRSTTGAGYRR